MRGESVSEFNNEEAEKEGDAVQEEAEEEEEGEHVDLDEKLAQKLEEIEEIDSDEYEEGDSEKDDEDDEDEEDDEEDEYQPKRPTALEKRNKDDIEAAKAKFGLPANVGRVAGEKRKAILEESDPSDEDAVAGMNDAARGKADKSKRQTVGKKA